MMKLSRDEYLTKLTSIVESNGGKFKKSDFVNSRTKISFKCRNQHSWQASPISIIKGSWCQTCKNKEKLEKCRKYAESKNGNFNSRKYNGSREKHLWSCSKGHEWEAVPYSVLNGTWCPRCSGRGKTKKEIESYIESKNGKILSWNGTKSTDILLLECIKGHQWEKSVGQVLQGRWCPHCAGKRNTIKLFQELAKARGGKCLSPKYIAYNTKYKFKCVNNHIFESSGNSIRAGSWCPDCSQSYGERIVRLYFETIFGEKFKKQYPEWLINDRGNVMELDGFNEKLKIAFEHQGSQHFKPSFNYDHQDIEKIKKDDKRKKKLCKKHGVSLFIINDIPKMTKVADLAKVIKEEANRLKVKLDKEPGGLVFDLSAAYSVSHKEIIGYYDEVAKEKGGRFLSKSYLGTKVKHRFACKEGHEWDSTLDNIKSGRWCPYCRGYGQTVEEMRKLAAKYGGEFLSYKLNKIRDKHKWRCSEGHEWEAAPYSVKAGHWCAKCNRGNDRGLKDLSNFAKKKKGRLISLTWIGSSEKYKFECKRGHLFKKTPTKIIDRGQWCKECANLENGEKRRASTLNQIKVEVEKMNAKCTTKVYTGDKKQELRFICEKRHRFSLAYWKYKKGYWCGKCLDE